MNKENKKSMRFMEELRLPELQARFHDIVGEATRSPNKKFLLRRIAEALEAQEGEPPPAEPAPKPAKKQRAVKTAKEPAQETGAEEEQGSPLRDLSVEELQALYQEKVGRPTCDGAG